VSIKPARQIEAQPAVQTNTTLQIVPPHEQPFGRYTLLCRLASGGMANLYLGRYIGPDGFEKLVAIKRIHDHLADDKDFVGMFVDEARLAARISHPNVVQVLELGQVARSYFIAMEYVEGENLAQLIKRCKVPLPISARLISQAAMGLHAAHVLKDHQGNQLHVVHRDVSPQNVLVSYDGQVKMVDFGVAKAKTNLANTRAGTIKGKFSYMAPEQLKPDRFGPVDRRADIFPLGILLFEATTRRRLFKGKTEAETIDFVLNKEVLSPSLYVSDYPDELAQICMRALARKQEDRYQTAEEMHLALEAFLSRFPDPVLPSTVAELMRRVFADQVSHKAEMIREALAAAPAADQSYSMLSTVGGASGEVLQRRKVAFALGSVIVGLALIAVVLFSLFRSTPSEPVAATPPPRRDAAPAKIHILVKTVPASATIRVGGKDVPNPYDVRQRRGKGEVDVEVSAPDHRPQRFKVPLDEGGRWMIALERLPRLPPDAGAAAVKKPPRRPGRRRPSRPRPKTKRHINNLFTNPYEK